MAARAKLTYGASAWRARRGRRAAGGGGLSLAASAQAPTVVPVALFTCALIALWLLVDPRTPDLAAQVYRVSLYRQLGFAVWDDNWYAGHGLPAYSLIYPPLAVALGMRVLGAASVLASSMLFWALVRPVYGRGAPWGAAFFALAALGDVWSGRLTFALGVSVALAAAVALARGRWLWAAVLAAVCAAASPVAGALLGLAGLSLALSQRSPRALLALAAPAALVVLVLAVLFPEGGYEPYPMLPFLATMAATVAFLCLLPRDARLLRVGGCVYALACVACLLVHSPVGSNVERYGVLLAGPLLLCARVGARGGSAARASVVRAIGPAALASLCAIAAWVVWGPVRETLAVAGSEATSAVYYAPLERFLAHVSAPPRSPVRVEVPLTRSHWEAALLAPEVSLARGWEKQLETRYDGVLLSSGLSAGSYERWLHEQAVAYVAVPDLATDPSSARERALIEGGLPYLRPVFRSRHWRVYAVRSATPLASGPGRLSAIGHEGFTLQASAPGRFLVRVHFTRYWTLTRGRGCVARASGGWTRVLVSAPGTVQVSARFSLARALGAHPSCG